MGLVPSDRSHRYGRNHVFLHIIHCLHSKRPGSGGGYRRSRDSENIFSNHSASAEAGDSHQADHDCGGNLEQFCHAYLPADQHQQSYGDSDGAESLLHGLWFCSKRTFGLCGMCSCPGAGDPFVSAASEIYYRRTAGFSEQIENFRRWCSIDNHLWNTTSGKIFTSVLYVLYNIDPLHQEVFLFCFFLGKLSGSYNGQPAVYILARGIAFLAEQINIHICQLLILQSK